MKIASLSLIFAFLIGINTFAQDSNSGSKRPPPDDSKIKADIAACEESSVNVNNVKLPTFIPGERPNFTDEQVALLKACMDAGLMQAHRPPNNR